MVQHVLLRREGTHAVPEEEERRVGMLLRGDAAQPNHVLNEKIETAGTKISEAGGRKRGSAVAAMVIAVNGEPCRCERLDRFAVAADMFAHAMCDLHDAGERAASIP